MIEVYCKNCNDWFASRLIQMDEEKFKSAKLAGSSEPCPVCGTQAEVSNDTVRFNHKT